MTAGLGPGGGAGRDEGMGGMRSDLDLVSWRWRRARPGEIM